MQKFSYNFYFYGLLYMFPSGSLGTRGKYGSVFPSGSMGTRVKIFSHSRESGNPDVRVVTITSWIPAFAGMTVKGLLKI